MDEPTAGGPKKKRTRRKTTPEDKPTLARVQFDIDPDDDRDFMDLVGPLRNRSTVALMLFYYGLDNSADAFAHYARTHQEARRRRLEAKGTAPRTAPPRSDEPGG